MTTVNEGLSSTAHGQVPVCWSFGSKATTREPYPCPTWEGPTVGSLGEFQWKLSTKVVSMLKSFNFGWFGGSHFRRLPSCFCSFLTSLRWLTGFSLKVRNAINRSSEILRTFASPFSPCQFHNTLDMLIAYTSSLHHIDFTFFWSHSQLQDIVESPPNLYLFFHSSCSECPCLANALQSCSFGKIAGPVWLSIYIYYHLYTYWSCSLFNGGLAPDCSARQDLHPQLGSLGLVELSGYPTAKNVWPKLPKNSGVRPQGPQGKIWSR